jgi:hypothetical protein
MKKLRDYFWGIWEAVTSHFMASSKVPDDVSTIDAWPAASGYSYTCSELDADPALAAVVRAQRRAVWDRDVFRPKVQRTDTHDSNTPKLEART